MSEIVIKRKLTQKERNDLKVLSNVKGGAVEAAKYAGITPQHLYNMRKGKHNTEVSKIKKLMDYVSIVQEKLKTSQETDKD